jgi:hypothetical protein
MKKYKINIAEDGRVLSATYAKYGAPGQPEVDELPRHLSDYRYVDGELVHDPLPKPEPEKPEKPAKKMTVEERLARLEKLHGIANEEVSE